MSEFHLSDEDLLAAIRAFVSAAREMLERNVPRPTGGFESVKGQIAGELELYMRGVSVARAALADAARHAGVSTRDLMENTAMLDAELTKSLSAPYAVKGRP